MSEGYPREVYLHDSKKDSWGRRIYDYKPYPDPERPNVEIMGSLTGPMEKGDAIAFSHRDWVTFQGKPGRTPFGNIDIPEHVTNIRSIEDALVMPVGRIKGPVGVTNSELSNEQIAGIAALEAGRIWLPTRDVGATAFRLAALTAQDEVDRFRDRLTSPPAHGWNSDVLDTGLRNIIANVQEEVFGGDYAAFLAERARVSEEMKNRGL